MTTDVVVVTTVTDSQEAAQQIANLLIERRLAACAQVSGPITSTYWWEGEIESATEWAVAAKTTAGKAGEVRAAIVAAHSYDVPEVLETPVLAGHPPYLAWVQAETAEPSAA